MKLNKFEYKINDNWITITCKKCNDSYSFDKKTILTGTFKKCTTCLRDYKQTYYDLKEIKNKLEEYKHGS